MQPHPLSTYRWQFHRAFPPSAARGWDAVDPWIDAHVPQPFRVAFRAWVATVIGDRPPPSAAATRRADSTLIERVEEFEVYRVIDAGGMGVVHEAYDTVLDRTVAIKRPKPGLRLDLASRFEREVRVTAGHPHPGIPAVYRSGRDAAGLPYMAMLFADGETLAVRLAGRAAGESLEPLLDAFLRVCQTVGSRHTAAPPVIHRDLKPSNIIVARDGAVFVLDWGLGSTVVGGDAGDGEPIGGDATGRLTTVVGTHAYMAPEQFGGVVSARSDVFQLGAILCELLTGQPPYTGNEGEMEAKARAGDLADARTRLRACGRRDLAGLALECLSPDPVQRPATGATVATGVLAIRALAEEERRRADEARRTAEAELVRATERLEFERQATRARNLRNVLLVATAAAVAVGGLLAWWQSDRRAAAEREAAYHRQWSLHNDGLSLKLSGLGEVTFFGRDGFAAAENNLKAAEQAFSAAAAEFPGEPTHELELADCRLLLVWVYLCNDPSPARRAAAAECLRRAEDAVAALRDRGVTPAQLRSLSGRSMPARGPAGGRPPLDDLRDKGRLLRGTLALAEGRYSEAFEAFDDLTATAATSGDGSRRRSGEWELLTRMGTTALAQSGLKPPVDLTKVWDFRDVAQMAAEVEQQHLPWSRGPRADHAKATRLAGRLADSAGVSDAAIYNAACAFTLAAGEDGLRADEREARVGRAITYLERIRADGYFLGQKAFGELHGDTDLHPLRGNPRFDRLLAATRLDLARVAVLGVAGGTAPMLARE